MNNRASDATLLATRNFSALQFAVARSIGHDIMRKCITLQFVFWRDTDDIYITFYCYILQYVLFQGREICINIICIYIVYVWVYTCLSSRFVQFYTHNAKMFSSLLVLFILNSSRQKVYNLIYIIKSINFLNCINKEKFTIIKWSHSSFNDILS